MQNLIENGMPGTVQNGNGDAAPIRLDDQLCFALYATSRAATAAYRPYLEDLGLTYPRYLVLLILWERDHVSVSELGRRLFLDSGTLTPLLKALATDGLITRTRDGGDERVVMIDLTDKGRALQEHASEVAGSIGCKLALPNDQVQTLRAEIWKLFTLLTADNKEI